MTRIIIQPLKLKDLREIWIMIFRTFLELSVSQFIQEFSIYLNTKNNQMA